MATEPSKWTDDAWRLRLAELTDVDALEALIPASVRALQSAFYSPIQIDAALGSVFGVDLSLADYRCRGWPPFSKAVVDTYP